MGNWNISIEGVGAHHNKDCEEDADKMARKFVGELKEKGHSLSHATFTHGSCDDLEEE